MEQSEVIGHYVQSGDHWVPALDQSSKLFRAVVEDDITAFEAAVDLSTALCWHTILCWCEGQEATAKVEAKSRSLAMLATQHGSLRVLSWVLSKGVNPKQQRDGLSCYEFLDSSNPNAPTIRAMLDDAAGNFDVMGAAGKAPGAVPKPCTPDPVTSIEQAHQSHGQQESSHGDLDSVPYATDDLTRPEYSTDTFRMYCFKHDWRACPFAHPTENARRRDPREFKYSSLVCPDYRQGCCVRGDTCQYAHGVFESWLHPSRYRTQLCKDQEKCDRPICFFAHSISELRTPQDSFVPNPEERLRVPDATQVMLGLAPPVTLAAASLSRPDTAYASDQISRDPQQQQGAPAGLATARTNSGNLLQAGSAADIASSSKAAGKPQPISTGSSIDQQRDQGPSSAAASSIGNSPLLAAGQQLITPSAIPVPRMSNAFVRKHGLDPKENPLVNLQRLALQQGSPQQLVGVSNMLCCISLGCQTLFDVCSAAFNPLYLFTLLPVLPCFAANQIIVP
eukprot:GHRR01008656.1.p1 GENE.GHRR01008656.1~~GHRR01008656.1.p1  ORF type:complete len:507 (+),score=133.37 GHRR01008656.1:159-1679(+)